MFMYKAKQFELIHTIHSIVAFPDCAATDSESIAMDDRKPSLDSKSFTLDSKS